MTVTDQIAGYFDFKQLGTNWRKEILAGATTFVTMAYIIFVNPAILGEAGLPVAAVTEATCLCAGLASILMGSFARYPLALAPGMGLNAYFAYSVVKGMGVPWQTALGAVFLSGVAFLFLTLVGLRQMIVGAIPRELFAAVAAGIGVFIAFIGLKNAGIIVTNPATLVGMGSLRAPQALLALFGLVVTFALFVRRVPGAILVGMLTATALGLSTRITHWNPAPDGLASGLASIGATAFHLDIPAALRRGGLEIIFVFLFVDLFDNLGTLVAVTKEAGLEGPDGEIPRLSRIFVTDSLATMFGSLMGTSTVTGYVESAAGIAAGGRSGVMAIVTGLLFLAAMPLSAVAGLIPSGATTPALVLVGALMVAHVTEIRWKDPVSAIPAFLTMITTPLTFSIATGISFGFVSSALLRIVRGPKREEWLLYSLALLCILRFTYLASDQ